MKPCLWACLRQPARACAACACLHKHTCVPHATSCSTKGARVLSVLACDGDRSARCILGWPHISQEIPLERPPRAHDRAHHSQRDQRHRHNCEHIAVWMCFQITTTLTGQRSWTGAYCRVQIDETAAVHVSPRAALRAKHSTQPRSPTTHNTRVHACRRVHRTQTAVHPEPQTHTAPAPTNRRGDRCREVDPRFAVTRRSLRIRHGRPFFVACSGPQHVACVLLIELYQ